MISALAIAPKPDFYLPFGGSFADAAGGVAGTVTGAPSSTDATAPSGSGATGFLGSNYVNYGNIFGLTTAVPYTICLWIKAPTTGYPGDWAVPFGRGENGWQIRIAGNLSRLAWTGHGADDNIGIPNVKDGVWRHYGFVWTGSTKLVYIDGVLAHTITGRTTNNGAGANSLRLGSSPSFTGREWPGAVDEVAIWVGTNLTPGQIAALASVPSKLHDPGGNKAVGSVGLNALLTNGDRTAANFVSLGGGTQEVVQDLLAVYYIDRVNWLLYYGDTRTFTNVALYGSMDGVNWTAIRSPANFQPSTLGAAGLDIPVKTAYRYLKYHGEANPTSSGNEWVEIEVHTRSPMTGGGYG